MAFGVLELENCILKSFREFVGEKTTTFNKKNSISSHSKTLPKLHSILNLQILLCTFKLILLY